MGGALLELLAVGEQDVHLINNPQFSYFKSVHRRHTNFAIESIPQHFKENADFGQKVTCIIEKKRRFTSSNIFRNTFTCSNGEC